MNSSLFVIILPSRHRLPVTVAMCFLIRYLQHTNSLHEIPLFSEPNANHIDMFFADCDRYVPILKQYKSSPDTQNVMVQLGERLERTPAVLEVGGSIPA